MSEQPDTNAEDDIKIVLQNSLMQTVKALLAFTRTEAFALQIPETGTHIFTGPLPRIAQFVEQGSVDWRPYQSALSRCAELLDNMSEGDPLVDAPRFLAEKLAQLVGQPAGDGLAGNVTFSAASLVEFVRAAITAHMASQSQATRAQAEPVAWRVGLIVHHDKAKAERDSEYHGVKSEPLYLAAPVAKEVQAVPEGWKLVPVEPTLEMHQAGFDTPGAHMYAASYRAMLAAAPSAPTVQEVEKKMGFGELTSHLIKLADQQSADITLQYKDGTQMIVKAGSATAQEVTQQAAKAGAAEQAKPVARLHEETSDCPFTEGKKYFEITILDRARCYDGMELFAPTTSTVSAPEEVRNAILEEAAEKLDAMNDSSGDAAAYDQREQNIYELEREHAISDCAATIRALRRTTC